MFCGFTKPASSAMPKKRAPASFGKRSTKCVGLEDFARALARPGVRGLWYSQASAVSGHHSSVVTSTFLPGPFIFDFFLALAMRRSDVPSRFAINF